MKQVIIGFIALLTLAGCKEIIAEDLTGVMPILVLPTENDTVDVNPVHFKWQEIEGADQYHLMVVSPSFSAISSYELDTLVYDTDFFFDLDSNEYELKLVAVNAGYRSDTLGPVKFWVGSSSGGGGTGVINLLSPADGVYLNATFNGQFTWTQYSGATSHEISIRQGADFATGAQVDFDNNLSSAYNSTYVFYEGEYHWGVNAFYSGGQTGYETGSFSIDLTPPNTPVLSSPQDLQFVSPGTVSFVWDNGNDPGVVQSPITSFVEVASDPGFTTNLQTANVVGSSTTFNLTIGTYFWRVTNTDAAGNTASVSLTNQFNVN